MDGSANGPNPPWSIELSWTFEDGSTSIESIEGSIEEGTVVFEWLEGAVSVEAIDMYGNSGSWSSEQEQTQQ